MTTNDTDGCTGCGRIDPMGIHYADCTLLEHGDLLMPRGMTDEQERAVDAATLPAYNGCSCAMWERAATGDRIFSGQHDDECEMLDV